MPQAALVRFDHYAGQSSLDMPGVVPILPLRRYCAQRNGSDESFLEQIPLNLAWAISAHKAHGMTIKGPVAFDIGRRELEAGVAYVQLSRATAVEDLYLDFADVTTYDLDRWLQIGQRKARAFAERNAYCDTLRRAHDRTLAWLKRRHPRGPELICLAAEDPVEA